MTTKLVAFIQELVAGVRLRTQPRPRRSTWRSSLAETRRGQWHRSPEP
ncbi:hypothetical protein MRBLWH7_002989 [Microbacterium sp. LWH7-1.2]